MISNLRYILRCFWVCSLLIACSFDNSVEENIYKLTPIATPDIPNWGSTPTSPELKMPTFVNCALVPNIPPIKSKIAWQGLTVGASSLDDVIQVLTETNGSRYWWNTASGNLRFANPEPLQTRSWSIIDTCYYEQTLAVLSATGAQEFILTLDEIMIEYGSPDRVTWANEFYSRSLLWAEIGLLLVVEEDGTGIPSSYNAILFSPIIRCKLEDSWIFQALPKDEQPHSGDVAIGISDAEDPWGIEKGLGDCP